MKEDTKACNLTKEEVEQLITYHGFNLGMDISGRVERINYLNKRLKEFGDKSDAPAATGAAVLASNDGWASN